MCSSGNYDCVGTCDGLVEVDCAGVCGGKLQTDAMHVFRHFDCVGTCDGLNRAGLYTFCK